MEGLINAETAIGGVIFLTFIVLAKRRHDLDELATAFISTVDKALLESEKSLDLARDWGSTALNKNLIIKLIEYLSTFQELVEPLESPTFAGNCKNSGFDLVNSLNARLFLYKKVTDHFVYDYDTNTSDVIHDFLKSAFSCVEKYGMELQDVARVQFCRCGYYIFITSSGRYSTTGGYYKCNSCTKPTKTITLR